MNFMLSFTAELKRKTDYVMKICNNDKHDFKLETTQTKFCGFKYIYISESKCLHLRTIFNLRFSICFFFKEHKTWQYGLPIYTLLYNTALSHLK